MFVRQRAQRWWQQTKPIAFLFGFLLSATVHAEDFRLSLDLSQDSHHQATTNPADAHEVKPVTKRPSITIDADSKITAAWKVTYIAKPAANDVLVHFYIVKISRSGQAPPPLAPHAVLLETAQNMDFANGTSTEAKLEAHPTEAGIYLVRLEAHGTGEPSVAEMELVVK